MTTTAAILKFIEDEIKIRQGWVTDEAMGLTQALPPGQMKIGYAVGLKHALDIVHLAQQREELEGHNRD